MCRRHFTIEMLDAAECPKDQRIAGRRLLFDAGLLDDLYFGSWVSRPQANASSDSENPSMFLIAARLPAPLHAPPLLTRLLVVRVLLEFPKQAALLQLHVEALEGAVDGLVRLYGNVDQVVGCLR